MDKEKYLNRIKYSDSLEPSLAVLKKLQEKHLLNVPFENLDIHDDIPIELSIDSIFEKIVNQKRGGFCYELNGLFYELLIALNFDAKRVSARVFDKNKGYGKEFDHFAIIVSIDKVQYLSDVGFGDFTFEPLRLKIGNIQEDRNGKYIVDKYDDNYFRVNKIEKEMVPEYIFSTMSREFQDFNEMCTYHQTSPKSNFTRKKLISLATENGRITLTTNNLKVSEFGLVKETEVKSEAEFNEYLQNLFYDQ